MPFLTELDAELEGDDVWVLRADLVYHGREVERIVIPAGFRTDLASVPRLPIIYAVWGDRCHREAMLHDYLFSVADAGTANRAFLEAMGSRGVKPWIKYPMYWAVCVWQKIK